MARERDEQRELPVLKDWITISRAAEMLGMSRQAAHKAIETNRITTAHTIESVGQDPIVVRRDEIEAMRGGAPETIEPLAGVGA
jgi:hypothetical protein